MSRALAILAVLAAPTRAPCWGPAGHAIVARAALAASDDLPPWFRGAEDALADLANAPDRWREAEAAVPALGARRPDHFFDLDVWGEEALPADRWRYVERAEQRRLRPETIGFLPFAILEEYGALLSAFRDARAGRPGAQAAALSAAGVLAHLAGDAAVPLHASRHHHGWVGPNPRGFTRSGDVHGWFESELVGKVDGAAIRVGAEAGEILQDVSRDVERMLAGSLAKVPRLYEVERQSRLEHDDAPAIRLVRERLAAGATLLARLWRTAWLDRPETHVSGRDRGEGEPTGPRATDMPRLAEPWRSQRGNPRYAPRSAAAVTGPPGRSYQPASLSESAQQPA